MRSILLVLICWMTPALAMAETIQVGVNGLVCAFCVKGIEEGFKAQGSINTFSVDLDKKLIILGAKPGGQLDDSTITKIVTDAGYAVSHIHREP